MRQLSDRDGAADAFDLLTNFTSGLNEFNMDEHAGPEQHVTLFQTTVADARYSVATNDVVIADDGSDRPMERVNDYVIVDTAVIVLGGVFQLDGAAVADADIDIV